MINYKIFKNKKYARIKYKISIISLTNYKK